MEKLNWAAREIIDPTYISGLPVCVEGIVLQ
jgi:hypothetical protein